MQAAHQRKQNAHRVRDERERELTGKQIEKSKLKKKKKKKKEKKKKKMDSPND